MTDRIVEIANKIKHKVRNESKERITSEQAFSLAAAVQILMLSGISEDYLIEVITHAATMENPEEYMDAAIMGAYYKAKGEKS